MKQVINSISSIIFLTLLGMTNQSFTTSNNGDIIVPQGTPVLFKLTQNLNSSNVEIGNVVMFEVANPVIVEGQEVISQGTLAEGEITDIQNADNCTQCSSQYTVIEIQINKVKAVDGKFIWLFGKSLTIRSKCINCPVEVKQGVRHSVNIQNTVRVKVR
jgi:hypothetical protein